jgi:hypothetical protein
MTRALKIVPLLLALAVTCQGQIKISREPRTNVVSLNDLYLVDTWIGGTQYVTRTIYGSNLVALINSNATFQPRSSVLTNLAGTRALTNSTASWGIGESIANDVLTLSVSNQVTAIASNSTTAQVDFTTTPDYRSTDVMRANLTLQLTNLVPGRSIGVYLTGDTNSNDRTVTVSTNGISGGCVIRWNLFSPTNGSTSFTVTNNARSELQLKCLSATEVWAVWGPTR